MGKVQRTRALASSHVICWRLTEHTPFVESPGGQSHTSREDSEPGPLYTPLSGVDDQGIERDYPGKSMFVSDSVFSDPDSSDRLALHLTLTIVPVGLAAAYFKGEFRDVGEWATGLENGGTGKWSELV